MVRRVTRTSSQELKHLILAPSGGRFFRPTEAYDEVYPNILLGEASVALSTLLLKELHVTHVLNAAHGRNTTYCGGYVSASPSYYDKIGIKFMGVPAQDTPSFYLKAYFRDAAEFIDQAVRNGGKVLVHCQCGISRSASLIAAYLMIKKGMSAEEAISIIRSRRSIFPNQGFLSQLCDYDYELKRRGELPVKSSPPEEVTTVAENVRATQNVPPFTYTPYPARAPSVTRSGYRLSTPFDDFDRRHGIVRARSEERVISDYRERSSSPDLYRSTRASSIGPEFEKPSTDIKTYSRLSPSVRSNYGLSSPYSDYNYYVKSRYSLYPYYQPNRFSPDSSKALLSLAQSTKRDLTMMDPRFNKPSEYSSYRARSIEPSYRARTIEPASHSSDSYNYSPYSYRSYSRYPSSSYSSLSTRTSSMPSVMRYPSLLSPALYSRLLKA